MPSLDELNKQQNLPHFMTIYDNWSKYARIANEGSSEIATINSKYDMDLYNAILFVGMGGSATAGEIVSTILDGSKIRCRVLKGSNLTDSVDRNTLVIASSVSGNTYETIQVVKSCHKRGIDTITLSAGGKLENLARSEGSMHINIENLGAPRISLPCLVYPILNIVKAIEPRIGNQIESSLRSLDELAKSIGSSVQLRNNVSKQLASFLDKVMIPVCYYSSTMGPIGIRFKNSLNENSKMHAICEDIEEACHNSIVPFSYQDADRYGTVLLRSRKDHGVLSARFDALKEFLLSKSIRTYELFGMGDTLLANIMTTIYLLDYTSVYLAFLKGYDPTLTPAIDRIKKVMESHY